MNLSENFVVFRLPDQDKIHSAGLDSNIISDKKFIFHSFDSQTEKLFYLHNEYIYDYYAFCDVVLKPKLTEIKKNIVATHSEYLTRCSFFIKKLKEKKFQKIILSRVAARQSFSDLNETFLNLCNKYPSAFIYLISFEKQTWIGASPERLVQMQGNQLKTVALAGTKAFAENREWTSKEFEEHKIVVDYITESLNDFILNQSQMETVRLGELQHLQTRMNAVVEDNVSLQDICRRLHPTPAVCGIPKEKAREFILQHEGYDRGFYTGYFGFITPDFGEIFVNLRCAQLFENQTSVYVGGGIMAESDPELEWEETELKSRALF